jgi:hypothetical protein
MAPVTLHRNRVSSRIDLAHAYAAVGDRDVALDHARQAIRVATQIKSDRQLRRLATLILPTGRRARS